MTGDIRIQKDRPKLSRSDRLEDLDLESLVALARAEGGVATTSWHDGVMSWRDWIGFQPYDKYPEPGQLRRIGDCMIEFAPSGIYVEDWRFQVSAPGLLAGLWLVAEVGHSGDERARRGGLVIAGDQAIQTIARRDELPDGVRAQDYVSSSTHPVKALQQVLECSVDFLERRGSQFEVSLSTDPRREGSSVALNSGFSKTERPGIVRQQILDDPEVAARLWRVDSLAADIAFSLTTPTSADRLTWLEREADTLIHPSMVFQRSAA
jgi:hypothetical protein